MKKGPPKAPKIPRCMCASWFHWVFQIGSPSLFTHYLFVPHPDAMEYWKARRKYNRELTEWKIRNRTCTREEWHVYRRAGYAKEDN